MSVPKKFAINQEEIPDAPRWLSKVLDPINQFVRETVQSLSAQPERELKTITLKVVDAVADWPITLSTSVKRPRDVRIGQILQSDGADFGSGDPIVIRMWKLLADGSIQIAYITNLSDNTTYQVTFVIEGE